MNSPFTLHSLLHTEGVQLAPVIDERQHLIKSICHRVQNYFDKGVVSVHIADVPSFTTADQCAANLIHMSLEGLLYIQSLVNECRDVPRPQFLGGPTPKH